MQNHFDKNQSISPSKDERIDVHHDDRFLEEVNLLNLEGLMFCTSRSEQMRIKKLMEEKGEGRIKFDREDHNGNKIKITFDARFGPPTDVAYRIFNAGLYKLTQQSYFDEERDRMVYDGQLFFGARELLRYSGREWSGKKETKEQFYAGLMQLYHTEFQLEWDNKHNNRSEELHLRPLVTAFFARAGTDQRRAFSECMFEFHPRIIEGYNSRHFKAFNMRRMAGLRPTGLIAYKRLFLQMGSIRNKGIKHFTYQKNYTDICHDWLVGHEPRKYESEIKRHVGVHFDDLVKNKFLHRYEIKKLADGDGFKIVFHPGKGFEEDFPLFYETAISHLPSRASSDGKEFLDRFDLLAYFHTKCGHTHQEFLEKEQNQVVELLERYRVDEIRDLIDFALKNRAKNTPVQVFGFVLGYVDRWEVVKKERMERKTFLDQVAEQFAVESCRYCDANGRILLIDPEGNHLSKRCPHDAERIRQRAEDEGYRVPSLDAGDGADTNGNS